MDNGLWIMVYGVGVGGRTCGVSGLEHEGSGEVEDEVVVVVFELA